MECNGADDRSVEVQGGNSGYVATLGGLSVGASAIYTPEEGISLKRLISDIERLKESFQNDKGMNRAGKLILRNEKASKTFTTEMIANIIQDEAKDRFQSRTAIPGHVQQGGTPSPMDRIRAVRLAVRAIKFIEENALKAGEIPINDDTACVVGIRGASLKFTSISELDLADTEWDTRRPKHAFWRGVRDIADMLSRPPVDDQGNKDYVASFRMEEKATMVPGEK